MVNDVLESTEEVDRPTSILELMESLKSWISETRRSRAAGPDLVVSLKSDQTLVIEFRLHSRGRAGIQLQGNILACWRGSRRFRVHLGNFYVKTALSNCRASVELTPRHTFRPLEAAVESIRDTKHPAFFTRALKAVADLDRELPERVLDEAISASSDYLVLLRALSAPSAIGEAVQVDPLAAARLRGIDRQRNLLEMGGGTYTAEEVGEILDISRQAVDKRRREGKLIGLTRGRRGYAYPAWQFENGRTMQYLEDVLDVLRKDDPWMQVAFFLNKNMRLQNRTPLEVLKKGQVDAVREAAASYGEHEAV